MQYTEHYKEQQEELDETSKALQDLHDVVEATNEDWQEFIDKYLNWDIESQ